MLEAQVHSELRSFLRQSDRPSWVHHLTMARLVARGLRLGRSALIQTGVERQQYYLSYLTPALLSPNSVILVTSSSLQEQLLIREIPKLQKALNTQKLITTNYSTKLPEKQSALILISSQIWLRDRLNSSDHWLDNIPTIIDEAENLERDLREYLTITISPQNWLDLQQKFPQHQALIRDVLIKLTLTIFAHPENPYQSHLLDKQEKAIILNLFDLLKKNNQLNENLNLFSHCCQEEKMIIYAKINRKKGQFTLVASPLEILNEKIKKLWLRQTILFISSYLENNKNAPLYRSCLGIEIDNLTCLQFSSDSQHNLLRLYLPKNLPLPNTSQFQKESIREIIALIGAINQQDKAIIVLTNDVPLKAQFAAHLAAQFGSRVILEDKNLQTLGNNNIIVCGWDFWQENQAQLPSPQLIIIATLPIPSLENPLIAAIVADYKNQGKDWFRDYLLPAAIKEMQTSLMSIRNEQGVVALLDNRVNFRSYGTRILKALEPFAKISYLDLSWSC
jgi:ATP-dependent DNA helicase DinG